MCVCFGFYPEVKYFVQCLKEREGGRERVCGCGAARRGAAAVFRRTLSTVYLPRRIRADTQPCLTQTTSISNYLRWAIELQGERAAERLRRFGSESFGRAGENP